MLLVSLYVSPELDPPAVFLSDPTKAPALFQDQLEVQPLTQ